MIQLRNLRAGYPGRPVLEGIDLDFRPGEVLALLGPNGCGKSTLLRTANGLLPKTGGVVLVDGAPLEGLSAKEIARKTAYLPPAGWCSTAGSPTCPTPGATARRTIRWSRRP